VTKELLMETTRMKIFTAILLVATLAGASVASARPHHQKVCHYHNHHRICR